MDNVEGPVNSVPPDEKISSLEAELKQARTTIRKLERGLMLANTAMERNKLTAASKDNLSKIIEEKKSELEKYMNLLLENCPDIIMLFNGDGKIVYCTEIFLKITGIAGFGMIAGLHYTDILGRYTTAEFVKETGAACRQQSKTGGPVIMHQAIDFSGKGNPRDYTIQVSPMRDEQGNNIGAMILFYDATDLLNAKREAEKANKAKSDFLATVSHEIRTPMNAIMGISSMMASTSLTEKQQNFLMSIQNSSQTLLTLINDILDFSKIEAGKLELVQEYFELGGLLRCQKEIFELLFPKKDLSFQCVFSDNLPAVVYGDEKRIGQIITNILNNALKYTREGGVVFRAEKASGASLPVPLQKKQGPEMEFIRFVVEDTGIGIHEEAMPRLFSAFEQFDLVRNKQVQGTGLGLAITRRLCTIMEGGISVSSVYGKGSVFTVVLPLKRGGAADLPQEALSVILFTAPDAKVLIVDDIEINLEVASFILGSFKIKSDTAQSGVESVEMVRNKKYDLILMDHMMPGMDGVEATRLIRSMEDEQNKTREPAKHVPIIALTANAVSGAREMFLANGFNGFLSKPMDNRAVAEVLLRWLPEALVTKG
jgi:PAS domain S-box-containing protein